MRARTLSVLLCVAFAAPVAADSTIAAAHHPKKKGKSAKTKLVKPGKAKVGDRSWCLVSGEVFQVEADSAKVEHEGKTYYFCCPGCDTKFAKDPAKYMDTKPDA